MENILQSAMIIFSGILLLCSCTTNDSEKKQVELWGVKYNEKGLMSEFVNPGGKTTKYHYEYAANNENQVSELTKEFPDGNDVKFMFDDFMRLKTMKDTDGTVQYKYDVSGNLISVKRDDQFEIEYDYDPMGRLVSLTLGKDYYINYTYDFLGRLSKTETPVGDISYEYYLSENEVRRTMPNGVRTIWNYLPNGSLQKITSIDKKNYVICKFTYHYRPDGLMKQIDEWTREGERSLYFDYDNVQRLIEYTDSRSTKITYSYDKFGNRIEKSNNKEVTTFSYDWAGRMSSYNGKSCKNDDSGNLTFYNDERGRHTFEYNDINQLKKVNDKIEYKYDGDGNLISRKTDNEKTVFVNNPLSSIWQPLLIEENGNQTYYIWEGNYPIASIQNGKVKYYLNDHLGSIRGTLDQAGTVSNLYDYSPFGLLQGEQDKQEFKPRFSGLFYDAGAKIYVTKARGYDPQLGRFLQIDPQHRVPFGSQKDLSLYAYCGDDPVNYTDVEGLQSNWVWGPENQAWQFFHNFSPEYAKQFYAYKSNQAIQNARGVGYLAGMEATAWDMIGGYIPGRAANVGQEKAQVIWSLLSGGTSSMALTGLGLGRSFVSSLINSSEGNFQGAALDIVGLSGYASGVRSKNLLTESNGQLMLNFMNNKAKIFKNISEAIEGFEFLNLSSQTYKELKSSYYPSNVGGVYLGGAGQTLDGLGQLSGIALNETNGELILLAEGNKEIDLPSLRIDDVVTIFRSVYLNGEAPFVSIDPDSLNPNGPIMYSRHGEATINTYVGWILFETDRIMKAYSLGEDNITGIAVKTNIASYKKVLDAMFEGSEGKQNWERFWIVPAQVEKKISSNSKLTIFDVPLKVNTQKMVMKNGKLVPAPNGKPSRGAEKFSEWFTENYDRIADEAFSTPPSGFEINTPVPVFKELRRIALITAIAENLRDQEVPFPFWMRGHKIKPCITPKTTPAITVEKQNGKQIISVYGGVNLSVADNDVIIIKASSEASDLDGKLATVKSDLLNYKVASFTNNNKEYQAIQIPGNDSKALAACNLNETDLIVPVNGNFSITLTRKFNSFIRPEDMMFDNIWTLDLPFLEEQKIPTKRDGDQIEYKIVHQLLSPLNSVSKLNPILYVGNKKQIGFQTDFLTYQNKNLHFNDSSFLVADEKAPYTIVYNRDSKNKIIQIIGYYGNIMLADIKLSYDEKNRLISALGSNDEKVDYTYNDEGLLSSIDKPKNILTYDYANGLVSKIILNEKIVREFEYNKKGQVINQKVNNSEIANEITTNEAGYEVKQRDANGKVISTIQYDHAFNPTLQKLADNTTLTWRYLPNEKEILIIDPQQKRYVVKQSNDGRNESLITPEGKLVQAEYNEHGDLLGLKNNGQDIVKQIWLADGRLQSRTITNQKTHFEYGEEGTLIRNLITAPGEQSSYKEWKEIQYDDLGRTVSIKDYSGLDISLSYSKNGEVNFISSNNAKIQIERTDQDLISNVKTSWGLTQANSFDDEGNISEVKLSIDGQNSIIEFENGLPVNFTNFGGSSYEARYYGEGDFPDLIKLIKTPNDISLEYEYNENGLIAQVNCPGNYTINYIYGDGGSLVRCYLEM